MAYATITTVRWESWFTNNTDITDAELTTYLTEAHWVVIWYVANKYDIALLEASSYWSWSEWQNLLIRIENLLTSWYYLIRSFWAEELDWDKNGYKKIDEAFKLLDDIRDWNIKLIWTDNAELPLSDDEQPISYPIWNASEDDRYFTVTDSY